MINLKLFELIVLLTFFVTEAFIGLIGAVKRDLVMYTGGGGKFIKRYGKRSSRIWGSLLFILSVFWVFIWSSIIIEQYQIQISGVAVVISILLGGLIAKKYRKFYSKS